MQKFILNNKKVVKDSKVYKKLYDEYTNSFITIEELKKIHGLIKRQIKAVTVADSHPEWCDSYRYMITKNGDVFEIKNMSMIEDVIDNDGYLEELMSKAKKIFNLKTINLDKIENYDLGSNFRRILTKGYECGPELICTPYEKLSYLINNHFY